MASVVFYSPIDPGAVALGDGWEYMVLPIPEDDGGFTIRLVRVSTSADKLRSGKMWIISPERIGNAAEAFARVRTGFEVHHPIEIDTLLARLTAKGLLRLRIPDTN